MSECPKCGRHLSRKHRRLVQKIVYSDVMSCSRCGYRVGRPHPFIRSNFTFLFSRHTHCINCGNTQVRRGSRRDRIDTVSNHLLSRVLRLFGAPVNKCPRCRLQYYDWRRPAA